MSKIKPHGSTLVQTVGTLVKSLLGKDAEFLLIPVTEYEDNMEIAVMTNMPKNKAAFIIAQAAGEIIKDIDKNGEDCDCPKCQAKKFDGNVVNISESNNIH